MQFALEERVLACFNFTSLKFTSGTLECRDLSPCDGQEIGLSDNVGRDVGVDDLVRIAIKSIWVENILYLA